MPRKRDNEFVENAVRFALFQRKPFLGHKFPPQVASWPGFDFLRFCPGELMHDSKVLCEAVVKTMIGKGPSESSYSNWSRDPKHRKAAKTFGIMEDIWPENDGALPWRLTKEQRDLLDQQMGRVMWPHYMERLFYRGHSFWTHPNRMWKARRKFRLLFFMLVTQVRDLLPALTHALNLFTWAIRRLIGQVHSHADSTRAGVLPGSRTLRQGELDDIKGDLIMGLVLLAGCFPITQLNPALHHFAHYVEFSFTHGLLVLFWMMGFERNNKHMKAMVKNPNHPDVSMAIATTRDVAARYIGLQSGASDSSSLRIPQRPHECVLWGRRQQYFPTEKEMGDFALRGVQADMMGFAKYDIAYVLGVHFKAGEWGQYPRCGSVITCVLQGRSWYARVNRFLSVEGDRGFGYASVTWFSRPVYPLRTPMVVKVTEDVGSRVDHRFGCIIGLDQIDPSRVMIEPKPDHSCFYMMRDSGYDTF